MQEKQNDFTKNSMAYNIMSLAIPMTIAQLINVLYSLVDRMYIGHLAQNSPLAAFHQIFPSTPGLVC